MCMSITMMTMMMMMMMPLLLLPPLLLITITFVCSCRHWKPPLAHRPPPASRLFRAPKVVRQRMESTSFLVLNGVTKARESLLMSSVR